MKSTRSALYGKTCIADLVIIVILIILQKPATSIPSLYAAGIWFGGFSCTMAGFILTLFVVQ